MIVARGLFRGVWQLRERKSLWESIQGRLGKKALRNGGVAVSLVFGQRPFGAAGLEQ